MSDKVRRIMIGTPTHHGEVELEFMMSFFQTMELCVLNNIQLTLKTVVGCSLIQKARDELFRLAREADVDDLIFIDSDQAWTQKDFGNLISPTVDVIGGAVVSKNDLVHYNVKTFDPHFEMYYGLIDARGVGTGFMRISKNALKQVWDASEEYQNEGKTCRMVFDIKVMDGQLVSEDNVFCRKWHDLGGKIFIDPTMTCNHIGVKKYSGNFMEYIKAIGAIA